MNNSIKIASLFLLSLILSCNNDDTEIKDELEGATTCVLTNGTGVCLDGPKSIVPGKKYTYAFKVNKERSGNKVHEVINWDVKSGKLAIIDIKTTISGDFTTSVATMKFESDFAGGVIKASTVPDDQASPLAVSSIQVPIGVEK
ncbi:hypothetical protein [Roseivirga echinicomitans]|uniref:Uncharacterized protein n=1 Tax=Roseivirga echinicomitans TaxID=296218 RepID=A0A150WYI3_9BACT|nr:hypothetical protein [Roseivirga echinicomitans]KYG71543.1 hypothetical protein AWN68_12420 [Roseivirga echinicomitans]